MSTDIREYKLSKELQHKICEYHGQFLPTVEIIAKMKEEHGITLSNTSVMFYKKNKKWKVLIDKAKDQYVSAIMEVPIAHKRVRLERYEKLYDTAKNLGKIESARAVLASAREELEGKNSINIQMNRIELISDDEINERLRRIKTELVTIPVESEEACLIESKATQ